jgi:hypothetical protein
MPCSSSAEVSAKTLRTSSSTTSTVAPESSSRFAVDGTSGSPALSTMTGVEISASVIVGSEPAASAAGDPSPSICENGYVAGM